MVLRLTLGCCFLKADLMLYSFLINVTFLVFYIVSSLLFIVFLLLVLRLHARTIIKLINILPTVMNVFS